MARFSKGDRIRLAKPHHEFGSYGIHPRHFGVAVGIISCVGVSARDVNYGVVMDGGYVWSVFESMLEPEPPLSPFDVAVRDYISRELYG